MKIGILTGGGDVPGLNPCIKAVVYRALDAGIEVLGIRRGWGGLLNYNPDDPEGSSKWILPLDKQNTRTIDRSGGTFLHTSRTNPAKTKYSDIPNFLKDPNDKDTSKIYDFTPHIFKVIEHLGLNAIITIGGDDTLSYAVRLDSEKFPVLCIPKTMDNDVYGTDYCIGFSTAVTRTVDFITNLRTPAGSHERIAVIEVFGRNSGETSLIAGYLAGVDRVIISEVPFDVEKLAKMVYGDKKNNPSQYAIMTISEGSQLINGEIMEKGEADAYGHKKLGGIGEITGDLIKKYTGSHIIYQQLAYLMRSGEPDALDRMVAISYANLAIEQLLRREFGRMSALRGGRYTTVPVNQISKGIKRVDVDQLYDTENYLPKVVNMFDKPMFLY